MTNFFLEELRKIYGDGRVIHDPQFVGECCYGSLGDLRVKARFTKDIVANQYPYLTVSILNPTKGEIDSVRMKIGDIISRSCGSTNSTNSIEMIVPRPRACSSARHRAG